MSEKLVRGIIYDDGEKLTAHDNAILGLLNADKELENAYEKGFYEYTSEVHDMDSDATSVALCNMNAIYALTDYNDDTEDTGNLIIPKRALSNDLVKSLESVDIGRDILRSYSEAEFGKPFKVSEVEPKCFYKKDETEQLMQHIDKDIKGIEEAFSALGIPVRVKAVAFSNPHGNVNHENVKDFIDVFRF